MQFFLMQMQLDYFLALEDSLFERRDKDWVAVNTREWLGCKCFQSNMLGGGKRPEELIKSIYIVLKLRIGLDNDCVFYFKEKCRNNKAN